MQIFCCPKMLPTARAIRDDLAVRTGRKLFIMTDPAKARHAILRIGSSEPIPSNPVLQPQNLVKVAANKRLFSETFTDKLWTPQFHPETPGMPQFPLVVRTTLTGFGGQGISICRDEQELLSAWRPGYFWTPFVETRSEFRVHVIGGKIAKVFKKRPQEGNDGLNPIRNMHNGWHFSVFQDPEAAVPGLMRAAEKLIGHVSEFLQTDKYWFGADMAWVPAEKAYITWEINSTPGLSENEVTRKLYVDYIIQTLGL